jgi:glycosyltransferase involved in cell wall biosynthesis
LSEACRVSVVVATYNRADVLRENLSSVLDQDFDAYEAVYVDDGSTDATAQVLEEFRAEHAGRLRVLRVDNGGQGLARNGGVKETRGEFLLFTDDDVTVPRDWISRMLAAHEAHGCDALCGGFDPHSMDTRIERYLHYRMQIGFGKKPRPISVAPMMNFLVPRAVFDETGGFIAEPIEDWVLCRDLLSRGRTIFYDPSVAVTHRYQTRWEDAVRRVRSPAILGMNDRLDNGRSCLAYMAYTTAKLLASPIWSLKHYPPALYLLSLRMEWLFWRTRLAAYLASLSGKRLSV